MKAVLIGLFLLAPVVVLADPCIYGAVEHQWARVEGKKYEAYDTNFRLSLIAENELSNGLTPFVRASLIPGTVYQKEFAFGAKFPIWCAKQKACPPAKTVTKCCKEHGGKKR